MILYKYTKINDYFFDMLDNEYFYCSNANKFDDVFDGKMPFDFKTNERDITYEFVRNLILDEIQYLVFERGPVNFEKFNKLLTKIDFSKIEKNELNDNCDEESQEAINFLNTAIADEKIRKETLKVIIKSIKDRGFVVDTKKNLKIDRQRNVVKLVAVKPDGKTAEFEISLNGKFMYRFEGYEGQACNKDINPFIEDLKNVYDINILHEEVQWSNPDKIQAQKYQYMNTNKGKN